MSDRRGRYRDLWTAVPAMLAGAAAVWTGTAVLVDVTAEWRVPLVVAGIALLVVGLGRLLTAIAGRKVHVGLWLSFAWLAMVIIAAALADLLPLSESRRPGETLDVEARLRPDLLSAHPLGTDNQGLDILGGIIYGARVSLIVGGGAVLVGALIGVLAGILAGFKRGRTESLMLLLADLLLAFPPLVLLLAMVAVLEPSVRNVTLGLAIISVPIYLRLARATTLAVAKREYVLAARVLGARNRRLIFSEIVPNVLPVVVAYSFVLIAVLIVAEASLSYLGLSINRPNPTWGNMIAAGQDSFNRHPHLVFGPGIVLFLTVFALNRVGEAASAKWSRRRR
ncbi:MAG: ABC transporter permease [Ilumatobacteraceae bacterium]|nr:ABC transporter permease [Ilumatobacteraceae bacterium]